MDTGSRSELLAANLHVDEIGEYLDVDSLAYLTLDRLVASVGAHGAGFCTACLTGEYPVDVPVDIAVGRPSPAPQDRAPGAQLLLGADGGALPAAEAGRRGPG